MTETPPEVDPRLLAVLTALRSQYGPLEVARAVGQLAHDDEPERTPEDRTATLRAYYDETSEIQQLAIATRLLYEVYDYVREVAENPFPPDKNLGTHARIWCFHARKLLDRESIKMSASHGPDK